MCQFLFSGQIDIFARRNILNKKYSFDDPDLMRFAWMLVGSALGFGVWFSWGLAYAQLILLFHRAEIAAVTAPVLMFFLRKHTSGRDVLNGKLAAAWICLKLAAGIAVGFYAGVAATTGLVYLILHGAVHP